MTLDTVDIEALGPALQNTVIDVLLSRGVGESETEGQLGEVSFLVVVLDELLQAVGDVLPQFIGGSSAQLLGHLIFGLCDIESALLLGQGNFANT